MRTRLEVLSTRRGIPTPPIYCMCHFLKPFSVQAILLMPLSATFSAHAAAWGAVFAGVQDIIGINICGQI